MVSQSRSAEEARQRFEQEKAELQRQENNQEREAEENIPQPEVPGAKPNANQMIESQSAEMTLKEFVNLKEIAGFNYSDYLAKILQILKVDTFQELLAKDEKEIAAGLLEKQDVEKLRVILKDGFKENKTIRQIENRIAEEIPLKDRITKKGSIIAASTRPNMLARTETVRVANQGLVNLYKENKIEKVRFLAALSDRTCPICESLNAQVFTINELQTGINQPPIHASCRCSLVSVIE